MNCRMCDSPLSLIERSGNFVCPRCCSAHNPQGEIMNRLHAIMTASEIQRINKRLADNGIQQHNDNGAAKE